MRWRLLRRRLSISAPRMTVRSHMPWPLRWALGAVVLGFSGALALWAFEFGKGIAGLDHESRQAAAELAQIRLQLAEARTDREHAQSIANAADSLLKAEKAAQAQLTEQVKALEMENQALKDDLGFFERLLPAAGEGLSVRGLQADVPTAGQLRFQMLVMQQGGRAQPDFRGQYEVLASGLLDGKPWSPTAPLVAKPFQVKQYQRVEGMLQTPTGVVVKQVVLRVLDERGVLKATQSVKL
jgi:hypothetical protein